MNSDDDDAEPTSSPERHVGAAVGFTRLASGDEDDNDDAYSSPPPPGGSKLRRRDTPHHLKNKRIVSAAANDVDAEATVKAILAAQQAKRYTSPPVVGVTPG